MQTIKIDIVNPKAMSILQNLADLNLIKLKKSKMKSEFIELLNKLRFNTFDAPTLEEITAEVEAVRKQRYEK
jgi:hypothetical protein